MPKRKNREETRTCCSCQEANLPHLLLIGCSNQHTMCHVCSRQFLASKLGMHHFPLHSPGMIRSRAELVCPLCQEHINGLTNIFVPPQVESNASYMCPYHDILPANVVRAHGCQQEMTLSDMQAHILSKHNRIITCPHCNQWLSSPENVSMEKMLQDHVLRECQEVPCHGCERTSNMINLYMHSTVGEGNACDSSKTMFKDFGQALSLCHGLFETSEDMVELATLQLKWVLHYLATRMDLDLDFTTIGRIKGQFLINMYCRLHSRVTDEPQDVLRQIVAASQTKQEYSKMFVNHLKDYLLRFNLRLNQSYNLPYFYRLISTLCSNFEDMIQHLKDSAAMPVEDNAWVENLADQYDNLVPEPHNLARNNAGIMFGTLARLIDLA